MTLRTLGDDERLDWIRLARSENVGPVAFFQLLRRAQGDINGALELLPELAQRGGRNGSLRIPTRAEAAREIEALQRLGATAICACEPSYPRSLAAIHDPPPVLTAGRNTELLLRPAVAIVGARNASTNGRRIADRLARDLTRAGWVVVSGLARGIDSAAHEAALDGGTVAVVAGGIDVAYPPENAQLHVDIFTRGCIAAEMRPGIEPHARHFPRRNRIVAGLVRGLVVVEAALHSGSLISARFALEQGREVFAVPGSPLDARARGTNDLIRQGAHLTESAEDIVRELGPLAAELAEPPQEPWGLEAEEASDSRALAHAREIVSARLSSSPVAVDELVRDCQLSAPLVRIVLLELELAGRIERQAGHRVALI
ncbi:MAG: smf [Rhodospirillales bacterium]|nr:smf [Rhodospirillales bacterium]